MLIQNEPIKQLPKKKTEGRRPPGRPRLRWEDNITVGFTEILWEGVV
jgi:hypothetical protein